MRRVKLSLKNEISAVSKTIAGLERLERAYRPNPLTPEGLVLVASIVQTKNNLKIKLHSLLDESQRGNPA